jgi:AraC-like DNA-binding protein
MSTQIPSLKEARRHGSLTFPCAFYQADYRYAPQGQPFVVKHHWQEIPEIIYFEKGTYQVEINMKSYTVCEECLCFINSGELHFLASKADYLEQAFVFSPSLISFELPDSAQNLLIRPLLSGELAFPAFLTAEHPAFGAVLAEFKAIRRLFCGEASRMQDQYTVSSIPAQLRTRAALLNILAILEEHQLLSHTKPESNHRIEALKSVMTYIKENYQEKIYISDLAQLVNMNEQYFCRFFKKALGRTPVEYINDFRIRQAIVLLQETELPVMDVCLECGFNNLGHFMKEFKKSTQLTPLQLRRRHLEQVVTVRTYPS